jgi:hypothetical protein
MSHVIEYQYEKVNYPLSAFICVLDYAATKGTQCLKLRVDTFFYVDVAKIQRSTSYKKAVYCKCILK